MSKLTLVRSETDQCLYVDNERRLVAHHGKISAEDTLMHLVDARVQVSSVEFVDVNESWFSLVGRMPDSLNDVVRVDESFEILEQDQNEH